MNGLFRTKIEKNRYRSLEYFRQKNLEKKLVIMTHTTDCYFMTLVLKKSFDFFAEHWQKSPKIVIIALTPEGERAESVYFLSIVCLLLA
jgi:hypothetical protein